MKKIYFSLVAALFALTASADEAIYNVEALINSGAITSSSTNDQLDQTIGAITFDFEKGTNNNNVKISSKRVQLFQGGGQKMIISAAAGYSITEVLITVGNKSNSPSSISCDQEGTWNPNFPSGVQNGDYSFTPANPAEGVSYSFAIERNNGSNGRADFSQIKVTYESAGPDTKAPVFTSSPADGETKVSTAAVITLKANEDITAVGADIAGTVNGTAVTFALGDDSRTLTYTPEVALSYETLYTVVLASDQVQDAAGNKNAEYSFSFTTTSQAQQPPVFSVTDGESIYAGQKVTITGPEGSLIYSNWSSSQGKYSAADLLTRDPRESPAEISSSTAGDTRYISAIAKLGDNVSDVAEVMVKVLANPLVGSWSKTEDTVDKGVAVEIPTYSVAPTAYECTPTMGSDYKYTLNVTGVSGIITLAADGQSIESINTSIDGTAVVTATLTSDKTGFPVSTATATYTINVGDYVTAISNATVNGEQHKAYDLSGRQTTENYRGVVIVNGKKIKK